MTIVRQASRADEADLLALCRELHADNGIFQMDDDAVRQMLDRAFDHKGGVIGVIDGDNEIAGAIYIMFSTFWYSTDIHLEELFNYIRPNHRKSTYAADLIEFAQRCADVTGLRLLIGVLTSRRMESKVRLYRRELGMPAGAFFLYQPKGEPSGLETSNETWKLLYEHGRGRNKKANGVAPSAMMTTTPLPMLPLVPLTN